jgi:hypothetical protein
LDRSENNIEGVNQMFYKQPGAMKNFGGQVSMMIDAETKERLRKLAEKKNLPLAYVVRELSKKPLK